LALDSPTQGGGDLAGTGDAVAFAGSNQIQQQQQYHQEEPECSSSLIDSRFFCGMDQACSVPPDETETTTTTLTNQPAASSGETSVVAGAGGGSSSYLWDQAAQLFQRSVTANTNATSTSSKLTFDAASAVTEPFDNRSRTWNGFSMNNYFRWQSATASPRNNHDTPKSVFQVPVEPVSPVGSTEDWDDQLAQHMEDKLKITPLVILEEEDAESVEARYGLDDSTKLPPGTSTVTGRLLSSPIEGSSSNRKTQQNEKHDMDASTFPPFLKEPPLTSFMAESVVEPRRLNETKRPPYESPTAIPATQNNKIVPKKSEASRTGNVLKKAPRVYESTKRTANTSATALDLSDRKPMARQETFPQTKKKFVKPIDDDFWKDLVDEGVIEASDLSRHSSLLDD
jgi:hypothetical protein